MGTQLYTGVTGYKSNRAWEEQHLPGIMSNQPCFRQQTHPLLQLLHMLHFQFTGLISLGPRNLFMSAACSETGPEFNFYADFVSDTTQNTLQVEPVLVPSWHYSENALLLWSFTVFVSELVKYSWSAALLNQIAADCVGKWSCVCERQPPEMRLGQYLE